MRAAVWVGALGLVLPGCWYFEDCPDNVGGVKEDQLLETTIVAPFERKDFDPACGDLGDLPPETKVTWRAHLAGSAETCDDEIYMKVEGHSELEVTKVGPTTNITLPDGCEGEWQLEIVWLGDESLLAPPDVRAPKWLLRRSFRPSEESAVCPGSVSVGRRCADSFVAGTHVVDAE